jgi:putative addiction module component (TIGR02574 family)
VSSRKLDPDRVSGAVAFLGYSRGMTERVQKVLNDALLLNQDEKAELVDGLLSTFNEETSAEIEAAWAQEIQRRLARARSGESPGVDLDEAVDRIKRRLHAK